MRLNVPKGFAGLVALATAATACGFTHRAPERTPGPGAVAGLVRSASTGAGVEGARVVLRRPGSLDPVQGVTDASGAYYIAELPPGPYTVKAYVEETTIGERETTIENDKITALDFAVGAAADGPIELNVPSMAPLWRYHAPGADQRTGTIEGTVADTKMNRVEGAVVSIVRDGEVTAEQTFTDGRGRYQVAGLSPGNYSVIANYAVVTRAQMEVRRNLVKVGGGETVVVPLWVETEAW
ncbi:MAG TPA: carboxypeptidase-like regulatory domain-containing protein [Kofleriaceae bacterium]|nr:carboxypeptidase-like regulatory domain-containing protein [Kofleriaceae bacterium]